MIRPPIIVFDETIVPTVYGGTRCVEGNIEAIDIDLYSVFDADGRKLPLSPESNHMVSIGEPEEGVFHTEELVGGLVRSLKYSGFDVDEDVPLDALVALSALEYPYLTTTFWGCIAAPFVALWNAVGRRGS